MMAVLFGGIIGYEREKEKRPAGLRTHILVSIGATLTMLTNIYMCENLNNNTDPTRIGAQVISGIGFLGAGTIMVTGRNKIRGLTTAAGLWASACMGLAIGGGFYEGAIVGFIFICGVIMALAKFDKKIDSSSEKITLYLLVKSPKEVTEILLEMQEKEVKITDIDINNNSISSNELIGVLISIKGYGKLYRQNLLKAIKERKDVIFIQEIL